MEVVGRKKPSLVSSSTSPCIFWIPQDLFCGILHCYYTHYWKIHINSYLPNGIKIAGWWSNNWNNYECFLRQNCEIVNIYKTKWKQVAEMESLCLSTVYYITKNKNSEIKFHRLYHYTKLQTLLKMNLDTYTYWGEREMNEQTRIKLS